MNIIKGVKTNRYSVLLLGLILLVSAVLQACTGYGRTISDRSWGYADLRAMDPVDTEFPHLDIIAVLIKNTSTDILIRIDLLDLAPNDAQDIVVSIDYEPGGPDVDFISDSIQSQMDAGWDLYFKFPYNGAIIGYDKEGMKIQGINASVFRDPTFDTITVNITKSSYIPENAPLNFDIYTLLPSSPIVMDSLLSVDSKSLPPSPAYVLLGFWNTLRAYTPAQSLRLWDGAHSGPMSNRFGLRYLIDSAEKNEIPVVLFDINRASSVVALDFLGVQDRVFNAHWRGLVFFGGCFWSVGVGSSDYTHNQLISNSYSLPIDIRRDIVSAAIAGEPVIIGGDFSNSYWGVPAFVESAFFYIKQHPWISPMISTYPNYYSAGEYSCQDSINVNMNKPSSKILDSFTKAYIASPENILKELVWQAYMTIMNPLNPIDEAVQESYIGQLGHILTAAEWVENPRSITACDVDLDWDGDNECILASDNIFLLIELKGGYLAFAFYRNKKSIHQITAPMSEVVAGLGDPLTYDSSRGVFSDPALIPGILAKYNQYEVSYEYTLGENTIELRDVSRKIIKLFGLMSFGVQIKWESNESTDYKIPLVLDPWVRFDPDWSNLYYKQPINGNWVWGVKNQVEVVINSSKEYQFDTFIDSLMYLNNPENPNFEYPKGHYLPFPTAVIDISPTNNGMITLTLYEQ